LPLEELTLAVGDAPVAVPAAVTTLIAEGEARIAELGRVMPGFVPSDHVVVYAALCALRGGKWLTGDRFCEWGCGLGIVAGMAAMLGYEAHAIEIEEQLVEAGERLARDFELTVEYAVGTFVPTGSEDLTAGVGDELEWLQQGGADGYELLGRDPDEFDLIFAYPWPGEEEIVLSLFERHAGHGAVLLTYHGLEGVRVHRAAPGRATLGAC